MDSLALREEVRPHPPLRLGGGQPLNRRASRRGAVADLHLFVAIYQQARQTEEVPYACHPEDFRLDACTLRTSTARGQSHYLYMAIASVKHKQTRTHTHTLRLARVYFCGTLFKGSQHYVQEGCLRFFAR